MSKHTKEPWHVGGANKCTVYDKFGQRIADAFEGVMVSHRSYFECCANASLIAAAPDLLEALEAYVSACKEQDIHLGSITGNAEAVIAKARGDL